MAEIEDERPLPEHAEKPLHIPLHRRAACHHMRRIKVALNCGKRLKVVARPFDIGVLTDGDPVHAGCR